MQLKDFKKYIIELGKIHKGKDSQESKKNFEELKKVYKWIERFEEKEKHGMPF